MADYKVTDTELTSVANKIRTKGGTQEQLEWPTGYMSAIDAISESATLVTKSITQNGTYDPADDNADGYSEITVNISGGTRQAKLNWDFTNSLTDTVEGLSFTVYGATQNSSGLDLSNGRATFQGISAYGLEYEIDLGDLEFTVSSQYYNKLFSIASDIFLSYNKTGWCFHTSSSSANANYISGATSKYYFNNSTIRIKITFNKNIYIYKDNVLLFGPFPISVALTNTTDLTFSASGSYGFRGGPIKAFRVY